VSSASSVVQSFDPWRDKRHAGERTTNPEVGTGI
jgi:hypothetical protein